MASRDMLINYVPGEECRIAVVQDGRLDEFYQERAGQETHVGNIYKGVVNNVEAAIQAAFIDFGLDRNGFLHISDLHPKYFPGQSDETELVGQKTPRRERPPIQKCLRRGQEILVQVLKEGIGTKGPTLTSYLSIPGRYLVMMPDMERLGVSRKVEDDEARREMRQLLDELKPPQGFGFIIRTAGIGRTKTEIKRDLAYLTRLWKSLETRMAASGRIGELYTESDLLIRTLRDVFSVEIQRIIIDDPVAARRTQDFFSIISPRSGPKVYYYRDSVPIFHRYDIERQIENINARTVPLPSGGSLVFDQAEALLAIDVNSGKSRDNRDAETTAYKTNLEAADEICRQLRLRDLGGVIINDLIDMISLPHRRAVEQKFKNNLKNDRARTKASGISMFGILEMTRQRMRPSLTKNTTIECAHCHGQGQIKSAETVVLEVLRRLTLAMVMADVARIELTVSPDVAFQLLNRKRRLLVDLESKHGKPVMVRVNGGSTIEFIEVVSFDARGGQVTTTWQSATGQPDLELVESGDMPLADEIASEPPATQVPDKLPASARSSVDQVLSQAIEDGGMALDAQSPASPLNARQVRAHVGGRGVSAGQSGQGGQGGRDRGRRGRPGGRSGPIEQPVPRGQGGHGGQDGEGGQGGQGGGRAVSHAIDPVAASSQGEYESPYSQPPASEYPLARPTSVTPSAPAPLATTPTSSGSPMMRPTYSSNPMMRPAAHGAMPHRSSPGLVSPPPASSPPQSIPVTSSSPAARPPVSRPSMGPSSGWRSAADRPEPGNEAAPSVPFEGLIPDDIGNRIDRPIPTRSSGANRMPYGRPASSSGSNPRMGHAGQGGQGGQGGGTKRRSSRRGGRGRGGRGRGGQSGQAGQGGQGGQGGGGGNRGGDRGGDRGGASYLPNPQNNPMNRAYPIDPGFSSAGDSGQP